MDPYTRSDGLPGPDSDAYWRRRVFVLAGMLAILGLLAWACGGALGGSEPPPGAAPSAAVSATAPAAGPAASTLPPTNTPAAGAPRAAGQSRAPAPSPSRTGASPGARPTRTGAAPSVTVTVTTRPRVRPVRPGDACRREAVVLSLFSARRAYGRGEQVRFQLNVVNVDRRACTLDIGPRALVVGIRSGRDRIWSTASCVPGDGSQIKLLRRGVPVVLYPVWDRKRSPGRCGGPRSTARPGTYVAQAVHGVGVRSSRRVFQLR